MTEPLEFGAVYARNSDRRVKDISPVRQIEKVAAEFKKRSILCRTERTLELLYALEKQESPITHDTAKQIQEFNEDVFVEDFGKHSGRSLKRRPEFKRLVAQLARYRYVGVADTKRTARHLGDFSDFMHALEAHHIKYIDVINPQFTYDTPLGRFMAQIYVASAEFTANQQEVETRDNYKHWKAKGAWVGNTPFGTLSEGHGSNRHLIADPLTYTMQGVTRRYLDTVIRYCELLRDEPAGCFTLSDRLNAEGYYFWDRSTKQPIPVKWTTLQSFMERTPEGHLRLAHYRTVIDDDLLNAALHRLEQRKWHRFNGRVAAFPPLLLSGLVVCQHCQHRLYAQNNRLYAARKRWKTPQKHSFKTYFVHRSDNLRKCKVKGVFHPEQLNQQFMDWMKSHLLALSTEHKKHVRAELLKPAVPSKKIDRRAAIHKALDNLAKRLAEGRITENQYDHLRAEYLAELDALPMPKAVTAPRPSQIDNALRRLDDLPHLLETGAKVAPRETNLALRDIFERLEVNARGKITKFIVRPEFQPFLDSHV